MKKITNSFNAKAFAILFIFSLIAFASNAQKSALKKGETLGGNEHLTSPNGQYEFFLILRLHKKGVNNPVWEYAGLPYGTKQLTLNEAGSIVVLDDKGKTIWSSESNYPNVGELRLQNDGNLVIYDSTGNDPIWALQDPKTDKYESNGNGFFIKYQGEGVDQSRYSNKTVNLEEAMKKGN